ncbi:MAG: hypothetical protein RR336_04275 [Oscillospiraceae bacterium]
MACANDKSKMIQKSWLYYYNSILHDKGVITTAEYNQMWQMIASHAIQIDTTAPARSGR